MIKVCTKMWEFCLIFWQVCANGNILTDIGHRGQLEAKTGRHGGQKQLSF